MLSIGGMESKEIYVIIYKSSIEMFSYLLLSGNSGSRSQEYSRSYLLRGQHRIKTASTKKIV